MKVEMQLYGRPEGRRAVEVGDGLCPHCEFVIEHCAEREPGAVFFVHRAGEPTRSLRRVKVIWPLIWASPTRPKSSMRCSTVIG